MSPKFQLFSTISDFEIQAISRHYYTKWPQNDLKHCKVKGTHICLQVLTNHKFHLILLYDQPFLRYKVVDNWKCTEWPQNDFEHLTVKSTLYTVNTTKAQICVSFTVWPAVFELQGCWKSDIGTVPKPKMSCIYQVSTANAEIFMSVSLHNSLLRPQTDLWNLNSQSTSYTLSRCPEAQIWVRLALWPAVFEM